VVEGLKGEVVVRGSGGWQAGVTGHIVVTCTHIYIFCQITMAKATGYKDRA
jgi:hypothetical protein